MIVCSILLAYLEMGNCIDQTQADKPKQVNIIHNQTHNEIAGKQMQKSQSFQMTSSTIIYPADNIELNIEQTQVSVPIAAYIEKFRDSFCIVKHIQQLLTNMCYSQAQLAQIFRAIFSTVSEIQRGETQQQVLLVQELFSQQVIQGIKKRQIYLSDIESLFKKRNNDRIREVNSSRIYYKIANIQSSLQSVDYGQLGNTITIQTTNRYRKLSDKNLNEIVLLENIAEQADKLGDIIDFKFKSIQKETEQITRLFMEIFSRYRKEFELMKYDLSEKQVDVIAMISRKACDIYQQGFYILLVYLVRSCKCLQQKGIKVVEIQSRVTQAVDFISKKYPPGSGLAHCDRYVEEQLKRISLNSKFTHKTVPLQDSNKLKKLLEIIHQNARLADGYKNILQNLIEKTCLSRCLAFKVGLKYNPKNPNPKALIRIQQKTLLKDSQTNPIIHSVTSISQTLIKQQQQYENKITSTLESVANLTFELTDMVRGKCTFIEIEDILQCVSNIKSFIESDNKGQQTKYRIVQIQSRFNNQIPISDITMKIAFNQEIVAELQLTLQTNFAAYNYAHKIYELQRTKAFSKIKFIHNYYEEYRKELNHIIQRRIIVAINNKDEKLLPILRTVRQYFEIQKINCKNFTQILSETVKEADDLYKLALDSDLRCYREDLKELMLPIFCKKMGESASEVRVHINTSLKRQQTSQINKNVLIYQLMKDFNPLQQYQTIKQIHQASTATTMNSYQFFLQEVFGIEHTQFQNAFPARLAFQYDNFFNYKQIVTSTAFNFQVKYICDGIEGINTVKDIARLIQTAMIVFKRKLLDIFQTYYQYIKTHIKQLSKKGLINPSILQPLQLYIALKHILKEQFGQAREVLNRLKISFSERHQYSKILECELLLIQCKWMESKDFGELEQAYKKLEEGARAVCVPLRSQIIAQSEWRIAESIMKLGKQKKDEKMIKNSLQIHYRKALSQFGLYKNGLQLIQLYFYLWKEYTQRPTLQKPTFRQNRAIRQIDINNIGFDEEGLVYISNMRWPNIRKLYFINEHLGIEGCKILFRSQWKLLSVACLINTNLSDQCCEIIAGAEWPNLKQLNLTSNQIKNEGCQFLSKGYWPNLLELNLQQNKLTKDGCEYLSKGNWKKLKIIILKLNKITLQQGLNMRKLFQQSDLTLSL